MADYAIGKGGLPTEILEADIIEKFGWTFTELDNEDQDRVYRAITLQNLRDGVSRIKSWLDNHGKIHISGKDLEIWEFIQEAKKENGNDI